MEALPSPVRHDVADAGDRDIGSQPTFALRLPVDDAVAETGIDRPSLDEITVDGVTFRTSVEDIDFTDDIVEI